MFSDKRSGDVLVSKLLVSHGRPRKPAFFITIHTDYADTGGAVSPLRRVLPTGQITAHAEKEFPLGKVMISSCSSLKNSSFFPLLMLAHFHIPGHCLPCGHPNDGAQRGHKVFLAAATSHLSPRAVLAQGGVASSS